MGKEKYGLEIFYLPFVEMSAFRRSGASSKQFEDYRFKNPPPSGVQFQTRHPIAIETKQRDSRQECCTPFPSVYQKLAAALFRKRRSVRLAV